MWPFSKKEDKKLEKKEPWQKEAIEKLQEFRSIGEKFNYLGREMVVCSHYDVMISLYDCPFYPSLNANYVDDHGAIHRISFDVTELETLKKENTDDSARLTHTEK